MPNDKYGGDFYYRGRRLRLDRVRKIVNEVKDQLKWAEEGRHNLETKWNDLYRQYRGVFQHKTNDIRTQSRLHVPVTFEKVEISVPKIIGDAPEWTYLPMEEGDVDPAIKINALMQMFMEQADLYDAASQMVHDGQVYGTGIVKTVWRHQVSHKVVDYGDPESFDVVRDLLYHGPFVRNVDLFNFYHDPNGTCVEDCEFIFERAEKTAMWLRMKKGIKGAVTDKKGKPVPLWQNIEEAIKQGTEKLIEGTGDQRREDVDQEDTEVINEKRIPLEVIEGWCLMEFSDQDGPVPGHITLVNGIPCLLHENPFRHNQPPYVRHLNLRNGNNFHGIGLAEAISKLAEEITVRRNMRLDAIKYAIRPEGFISSAAGVDPSLLVGWHPDRWIEVDGDPSKLIHHMEVPDYTRPFLEEEQILMDNIKNVAGIPEISQGIQMPSDTKTYGGIRALQVAADLRLIRPRRYLEKKSLKKLGWFWLHMAKQFLTSEFTVRVLGDTGQAVFSKLSPEELQPNFDLRVKVKPGEAFTEMAAREELVFILQSLVNSPNMPIYQANGGIRKIERLLLVNNEVVPNDMIDGIVGTDDEFQAQMAARQAEAENAEAQIGGGAISPPMIEAPGIPPEGLGGVGFEPPSMGGENAG